MWRKRKSLHTDRSCELLSKEYYVFCDKNRICKGLKSPYTQEQNGAGKRKNWAVVEMARSSQKAKGLPYYFWGEVVTTIENMEGK